MMILRTSAASPFARKARIVADLLGLAAEIELAETDTGNPEDSIRSQNPLGKIPALVLENGEVIYDSAVIVEYLDAKAGGGKVIPAGENRFKTLTLQALADGICDAAVVLRYEQLWRAPEARSVDWTAHQNGKIDRALAWAEAHPPAAGAKDAGAVALACALGYLDLRFEGRWRAHHPRLVAWLESFSAAVPAFEATRA